MSDLKDLITRFEDARRQQRVTMFVLDHYDELHNALTEIEVENERLRKRPWKVIPAYSGMVPEDFYAPEDVVKIRDEYDARIEAARVVADDIFLNGDDGEPSAAWDIMKALGVEFHQ